MNKNQSYIKRYRFIGRNAKKVFRQIFALATILLMIPTTQASPDYQLTIIGTGNFFYGSSINESGHLVGTNQISYRGYFSSGSAGEIIYLGTLGGNMSFARGLNDHDQIVGHARLSDGNFHAFVTDGSSFTLVDLGTLGGSLSYATDINNNGTIVGYSNDSDGQTRAFTIEASGGVMTDLGTLGGTTSHAFAINDVGEVTGYSPIYIDGTPYTRAFISDGTPNTMIDIGSFGGNYTTPRDINNHGHIVGQAWTPDYQKRAFLYTGTPGRLIDLGTLDGYESLANAINDEGIVVGRVRLENGEYRAFIYSNENGIEYLDRYLELQPDEYLSEAIDINEKGEILSTAFLYDGNNTLQRTVVKLTPNNAPIYFCEFLPPISQDDPNTIDYEVLAVKKKSKRSIPVKLHLRDAAGNSIVGADIPPGLEPVVSIGYEAITSNITAVNDDKSLLNGATSDGNQIRFNEAEQFWEYILSTRELTTSGRYTLSIKTVSPSDYVIEFNCSIPFNRE